MNHCSVILYNWPIHISQTMSHKVCAKNMPNQPHCTLPFSSLKYLRLTALMWTRGNSHVIWPRSFDVFPVSYAVLGITICIKSKCRKHNDTSFAWKISAHINWPTNMFFIVPEKNQKTLLLNEPLSVAGYSNESSALHTSDRQQTVKELTVDASGQCLPFQLHL